MTTDQAKMLVTQWSQDKLDAIFNPNLLCPGCEGQMGAAYTNLYTTVRQILTGANVDEEELFAAAVTIQHLGED